MYLGTPYFLYRENSPMYISDPFHESVNELRQLVAKYKLIEQDLTRKKTVPQEKINHVNEIVVAANDLLDLLREMMSTIEEKGGKVNGRVFSANEMIERQNILRELAYDVLNMQRGKDTTFRHMSLQSTQQVCDSQDELVKGSGQQQQQQSDDFLLAQERLQREEALQQDVILDRLTYGLHEIRETGVNINAELDDQNDTLVRVEHDISGVQVRLRAVNAKVDRLLASMSNRGKICTILILIAVIVFLAMFLM